MPLGSSAVAGQPVRRSQSIIVRVESLAVPPDAETGEALWTRTRLLGFTPHETSLESRCSCKQCNIVCRVLQLFGRQKRCSSHRHWRPPACIVAVQMICPSRTGNGGRSHRVGTREDSRSGQLRWIDLHRLNSTRSCRLSRDSQDSTRQRFKRWQTSTPDDEHPCLWRGYAHWHATAWTRSRKP